MGIIDRLKETKASTIGPREYYEAAFKRKEDSAGCCSSIPAILFVLFISVAGPIAELIVGIITFNDCPVNDILPIYVIVLGVISLVSSSYDAVTKIIQKRNVASGEESEAGVCGKLSRAFQLIVLLSMVTLFICGSIWVFTMKPCTDFEASLNSTDCFVKNSTYSEAPNYCSAMLLDFVFIGTCVRWGLVVIAVVIISFVCCPVCCVYCFA